MSFFIRGLWLAATVVFLPTFASAHGFGQRYDLPVPLGLFMLGAGASVVLSFLGMGLFVRKNMRAWIIRVATFSPPPFWGGWGVRVLVGDTSAFRRFVLRDAGGGFLGNR